MLNETENLEPYLVGIVAVANNGIIGSEGSMPWRLKGDLKLFKEITQGHPLVMGRKTFDSIGRPLAGRHSLVLSRNPRENQAANDKGTQVSWFSSLEELTDFLNNSFAGEKVFVAGGGEIYKIFFHQLRELHVTEVNAVLEGDTEFPSYSGSIDSEIERREQVADEDNQFSWTYRRLKLSNHLS